MSDKFSSDYINQSKHSIKNSTDTFENRGNLKFTGNVTITDDIANNNTVINITNTDLSGYVPTTRKIGTKSLSADISLNNSDVGLGNVTNDAQVKKISSSVLNNIVTFGATTGDIIKDSGVAISTDGTLSTNSDSKIPTEKAIKTALDGKQTNITTGNTGQYYRGDKSWQTLDKNAVGLGNLTNDAQVKKISSSVEDNIVTWGGTSGDTVKDSGVSSKQLYKLNTIPSPFTYAFSPFGSASVVSQSSIQTWYNNNKSSNGSVDTASPLTLFPDLPVISIGQYAIWLGENIWYWKLSDGTINCWSTMTVFGGNKSDFNANINCIALGNTSNKIALGTIYKGTVTITDVGGVSGSLPVSGHITSATAYNNSYIEITVNHPTVSDNAIYSITVENLGNQLYANDITQTVFTRVSTSQIRLYYEEISTSVQNIKLNIMIID